MGRPYVTITPHTHSPIRPLSLMGAHNIDLHSKNILRQASGVPLTMASTSSQPQQINVTDLDLPQLADVRRQLEEVRFFLSSTQYVCC